MRPHRLQFPLIALAAATYLTGCASVERPAPQSQPAQTATIQEKPTAPPYKGGGYYQDDGPGRDIPANLDQVPDAVPKAEPLHRYANNPYKVNGRDYEPITAGKPYREQGKASWYGRKYDGKKTSSGEPYDMYAMTAAHTTLPIPSYAKVTNLNNGKTAVVRINDRGPFHEGRIIDLSYTAAYKLDALKEITPVEVELLSPGAAPDSFVAKSEAPIAEVTPLPAAPVAEQPIPATPAIPAGDAVYLQLGAFSNPETADALAKRAFTSLPSDLPAVRQVEAGGLYKVQVGPFANADAADQAITRIREGLDIRAIKVGTKPAAAVAAPPAAAIPATPGLYLQMGAVSNQAAADALTAKIRARFGSEVPGVDHLSAGNLIKVQAGPFPDAESAEKVAQAYLQDFGVKPYKVRR